MTDDHSHDDDADENSDRDGADDSDAGSDPVELTAEQAERMREVLSALAPRIKFQGQEVSAAIARSMANSAAVLGAQARLREQMNGIVRQALAQHSVWQADFSKTAARLLENIDLTAFAAKTAAAYSAQQTAILKNLMPAMAAMQGQFYPPNLRGIPGLKIADVSAVVMSDGIPLYGVPRTATAQALVAATTTRDRREILGRRWTTISADSRALLLTCQTKATAPYIPFALAALDALDAGHSDAAQALAGSLIDAMVTEQFGQARYQYTPNKKTVTTAAYNQFTIREFIAFAPIWQTYQQFFVSNGDKVPMTFSRNATAHTVSRRQYNRRNAVQALMIVVSLLYRFDEEAASSGP